MRLILSLFVALLLCSSCSRPCCDYSLMGADEFVMDSYQIRQGKTSILEMTGKDVCPIPCDAMEEYRDVIAEDDILSIALYHPSRKDLMQSIQFINEVTGGFKVTNGEVNLPDIPPVYIAGLTLDEAKQVLQDQFQEHVKDAEIFITYRDRLSRKVELVGMVAVPSVPVDGKMRLFEVLARAHIPVGANLFMSYISRRGCPLAIDLHQLINEGDMSQNIVMRGGDKIYIANPTDATVMVMGEVFQPRAIPLPYGFISLREAIVMAGGIPFTGDRNHIQVIRGNLSCPKIYVLSWNHIIHLPNDSLLLMPGDTVYISEKPITQWNRFIEQLFPSFQGLQTGCSIYRVFND